MKQKVMCVGYKTSERLFTIGKIYEVEDNTIANDNGTVYGEIGGMGVMSFLSNWYEFEYIHVDGIKAIINDNEIHLIDLKNGGVYSHVVFKNGFEIHALNGKSINSTTKKEFEPYLVAGGYHRGIIGTPTKMRDITGEQLFVGDTVVLVDKRGSFCGEEFICRYDGKNFVAGIGGSCNENGTFSNGWIIVKTKSYKDLKHNEKRDYIIAVLEEE